MTPLDDLDLLAAEYALGTLDASERAAVAARLGSDPLLSQAVRDWQARLSPLSELTASVAPPPGVFEAIKGRLFGTASPRASLRRLRRWQMATAAFAALAAALVAWIAVAGWPGRPVDDRLFAVLQRDPGAPAMVLDVDLRTRRLTVRSLAPATPDGTSYELWLIDPALGAPRSLGTVPTRAQARASLAGYAPAVIADATYAVTLEPAGGAPDGRPSGAPLLAGKLVPQAP